MSYSLDPRQSAALDFAKRIASGRFGGDWSASLFPKKGALHFLRMDRKESGRPAFFALELAPLEEFGLFEHRAKWARCLADAGAPCSLTLDIGQTDGFSWAATEWIQGQDIGTCLPSLSIDQKHALARQIHSIQTTAEHAFEPWARHGLAGVFDGRGQHQAWSDFLMENLRRSMEGDCEFLGENTAGAFELCSQGIESLCRDLPLRGFLWDFPRTSAMVYGGSLSGILPRERAGFGDRLLACAQADCELLHLHGDRSFALAWSKLEACHSNSEERLCLYRALCGIQMLSGPDFLSHNRQRSLEAGRARVEFFLNEQLCLLEKALH